MLRPSASLDFRKLFDIIPGSYIILLPDLTVAAVSDEYLRATMVGREDLLGRYLFDVFPENPDDPEAHRAADVRGSVEKVFRTGETDTLPAIKYDVQRPASEGGGFEERFWKLATYPFFGADGRVEYAVHRIEDITEQVRLEHREAEQERVNAELKMQTLRIESQRKLTADALEDARLRLESALEAGEIGTWTWDIVNNRVVADENLARFFSVSFEDASGGQIEKYTASIHPDDSERVAALINEALENGDSYIAEYRLVMPDGAIRWVVARGRILRDETGKAYQLPGVVIDIPEHKRVEEKLRLSDERFQLVTRATNDAIWDWNLQTDETWWNDSVEILFGYPPEEVGNTPAWWFENIHPADRERVVSGIHEVIDNGGENWSDEYRFRCADGSYKYVFDRGFAMHSNGKPARMLGAMQDVTARRAAEEALLKSQERLQLVLDSSELGLWYCDLPFDVLNWSDLTKSHFWLPTEATVTIDDFYRIIHPDDREKTRFAIDESIASRTHYDVEYRTVNPSDGRTKWIRAIGRGFYDKSGNPYRFDGITIDISEDKQIQTEREKLLASEKNARTEAERANRLKDDFLATLSHELRTPLSSILGWARMLKEKQIGTEQTARAIDIIERNARSQAQLIEDILDVSRIISGKLRLNVHPVDLSSVIEMAIESVRPAAAAKSIHIQRILDSGVMISGDIDRLQQIIWNLLSNAIKFTPKEGRVQIKCERVGSHVEVTVADNGMGIDAETLPFIFERFRQSDSSTTRAHGGLGLGLAIVRHLVELHGGSVQATSEGLGRGAVFSLTFPIIPLRSENVRSRETGELEMALPPPSAETDFRCPPEIKNLQILLVDDEPDTREMLAFVFRKCEAEVTDVASVAEALDAIKLVKYDVLVSDIGMPERDGYDLIRNIRQLAPEEGGRIPAVALTAYARFEDRIKALSAGFQMHIPKPVEPAELLTIVAGLADWNRK